MNLRVMIAAVVCMSGCLWQPGVAIARSVPATPPVAVNQSMDEAWWTGPMLANSAETLPPGHILIEPYVYDVTAPRTDGFGSRAYMLYGLADRLTVGLIPIVGYNRVSMGPNSSGVGIGDLTLQAQFRLTEFHEGSWLPTIAIQLQEALPTGKYDRLGNQPADGLGSGVYATTLGINSQTYFWLPNGRILRMRFNVSQSFPGKTGITGVSVYGTGSGFYGTAKPGSAFLADAAWEYSLSQRWVLALDVTYSHARNTRVLGSDSMDGTGLPRMIEVRRNSGTSSGFGFAPAVEYSWTPNLGVLFGVRVITGGHNNVGTLTPAFAINYVH